MSIDSPIRLTPDELLAMPDGNAQELIDGELRELKISEDSSWIAGEILFLLRLALATSNSGWVFPEGTAFRCFEDPNRVRRADASFIRRDRRPRGPESVGFTTIAPDLVVGVVSPSDLAWEVSEKVEEWLATGVDTVWLVMPQNRTVTVYRQHQKPQVLENDDVILFELIPGFRCKVADFFPPRRQAV